VSGGILAVRDWAKSARVLLVLSAAYLLPACSTLVGDVDVQRPPDTTDAGPGVSTLNPTPRACLPGLVRCQGPVLQTCEADGSGWRALQRCASAALCVDAPGEVSRCIERACEPGIICSGADLLQCNAELTGFDPIDSCESAAHCDAMSGACEETRCVPGEVSCNGATLQKCNDGPTGYDVVATCATAALCDDLVRNSCGSDALGCDVTGAACPEPSCEPGQLRCTGTRLEVCNDGRNGWDFVDECVTPGVCEASRQNPVAQSCVEPLCDGGDVICSPGGARLACNLERTEYSVTISQCQRPEDCTPAGCQVDPCTVGELSCNGTTLQQCQVPPGGGRPNRVAVQECATQTLCQQTLGRPVVGAPACVPPSCAPGEFNCAGRQMQVCNAERTAFSNTQLCATDALCSAGQGLGACPTPCSGAACNGSMLRLCNAELTSLVDVEDCGSAAECDSGSGRCTDPCVVGALRCNGNGLERCQDRLQGWQRLQTCVSAGLCQDSVAGGRTTCTPPACALGQHRCSGQRLEACNATLTGFDTVTTCAAGQVCDAQSRQCDVCVPGAVDCEGDRFERCALNGQSESTQTCGAGLCSETGNNVGCLACATPGGFRCDNQGSLFGCSADQLQENQLEVCRTPQLCRQNLGRCLECDPPGSSRCEAGQVLSCSPQNTENVSQVCESEALCQQTSATSATCEASRCTTPFQCTDRGEVLVCNPGQTGYVRQSPPFFCETTALCDATDADGCQAPACAAGERQCNGISVEVCNDARTGFRAEATCSSSTGFTCVEDGNDASCACTPNDLRCVAGQGLSRCNGSGTGFAAVSGGFVCDGAERLSCSGTSLVRAACVDAEHCTAGSGASCAGCVSAGECSDGSFCNGAESCVLGDCRPGKSPCAGQLCSEGANACVQCLNANDCPGGQTCTNGACVEPPDGGT
jgi:hypothetical protein